MQLCNLHIMEMDGPQHIRIENGRIESITDVKRNIDKHTKELRIEFENAIAFPGLINSHDHLDFNLFPQSGNRIYKNYAEWGKDIHATNQENIKAVLKIPQHLRIQWGLYKNLLNGITTVVNHGARIKISDPFISVLQNSFSLHSVQFEKHWKLKLNNPFHIKQSYVIHAGEGIDEAAHKEIDKLIKANYFHKSLFAVHGVAMDEEQAKSFKAVIWCPVSNFFLLNKTADIQRLKTKTRILFGTDSTLTADWNLWNHLRVARNTGLMNDQELYQSLTKTPSLAWNQNNIGAIAMNKNADIIIAKITQNNHFDTFYSLNPESLQLVLHQGQIRLFDEEIKDQLMDSNFKIASFSPITIHGKRKYIYGNMGQLMDEISTYYSESHFPINKCTTAF